MKPYIGCDLDGTLALYEGWKGLNHIGPPIEPMVKRIKKLLAEGKVVKIFTARVDKSERDAKQRAATIQSIQDWTEKHIGKRLEVTNEKDYGMIYFYDDRAVQVGRNTGEIIGEDWEDQDHGV